MRRKKKVETPCEKIAKVKVVHKTKGKPVYFGRAEDRVKK